MSANNWQGYKSLAQAVGLTLEVIPRQDPDHDIFRFRHPNMAAELDLTDEDGMRLLEFLAVGHFAMTGRVLEQHAATLEKMTQLITTLERKTEEHAAILGRVVMTQAEATSEEMTQSTENPEQRAQTDYTKTAKTTGETSSEKTYDLEAELAQRASSNLPPYETEEEHYKWLLGKAYHMGARLFFVASYRDYENYDDIKAKHGVVEVKYVEPKEIGDEDYRFTLPQEFELLERVIDYHLEAYRKVYAGVTSKEGFAILPEFHNGDLYAKLQDLAKRAGGRIRWIENTLQKARTGRFDLFYYRFKALRVATLTNEIKRMRTDKWGYTGFKDCRTLKFMMPEHYDLLHDLLENDVKVYNYLHESDKRPADWEG